ncbi:MAG: hypothetical protein GF346_09505 [Candidatus Eisenbacteria bacterium]|nr:hypothetical protein [Candidatus Latescibacterota bacterium]MBD3302668.1 hypothetical protein [Candidatus Eisenbacteria bacterium]
MGFHSIIEPDTWWHIKVGADILSGLGIPRIDAYSYPSAGEPYVDLHWLFQVLLHSIHQLGGEAAVIWAKCLIALGSFALVYRLSRRWLSPPLAALLVVFGGVVSSERLLARPEIVTYLLLAVCLWLLRRHLEGARMAWLALPAVVLLWVNVEGLFILGPIVIGAYALGRRRDRKLWLALGLSIIASLANPYFLTGALHPFTLFMKVNGSLDIYSKTIAELLGPFEGDFQHPAVIVLPYFLGLIGLTYLLYLRRPHLHEALLLVAFIYLAISSRRNLPLLAIVATPIAARWLGEGLGRSWFRSMRERIKPGTRAVITAACFCISILGLVSYDVALANGSLYNAISTNRRFGTDPAPVVFPRAAVEFLRANDVDGPLFNLLGSGGYLIYAYPEEKVFIDGRLEVHSTAHYKRYLGMLGGGTAWKEAEEEFDFRFLILNYASAVPLTLERLQDVTWEPVYLDDTVIVLVRNDPANEQLIRTHRITRDGLRAGYPSIGDFDLDRLLHTAGVPPERGIFEARVYPWGRLYLGQLFGVLRLPDLAAYQFAEAVEQMPRNTTLRFLLVDALVRGSRTDAARRILAETSRLPLSPAEKATLAEKQRNLSKAEQPVPD